MDQGRMGLPSESEGSMLEELKGARTDLANYLNSQTDSKELDVSAMKVRECFAEWVRGLGNWDVFGTLTVRPPQDKEKGRGYTQRGRQYVWRKHGKVLAAARDIVRYRWHGNGTVQSFSVLELHDSGVPHIHYLLEVRPAITKVEDRRLYCELLQYESFRLAGLAKVEWVSVEHGDPAGYVTKYVMKEVTGASVLWKKFNGDEVRL